MGKMKVKMSSLEYAEIGKRERQNKRNKLLIWLLLGLMAVNFAWDVLDRQDDIEYQYNKISEKIKEMRN